MAEMISEEISELKKDQKFYVFNLGNKSMIFIKISNPYRDIIDVCKLGKLIKSTNM